MGEPTLTAEDAAKEVQSGNGSAYGSIVSLFEPKLSRYLSRLIKDKDDRDDILQNSFIKAYINIQSYDTSQSFSPWIYRITHNEAVNFMKKKKNIPFSFFEPDTLIPYCRTESTTIEELDALFDKKELDAHIEKLSIPLKESLILFYYEDMTYKEIARTLHIPVTTVGVRITRAKDALRTLIKNHDK